MAARKPAEKQAELTPALVVKTMKLGQLPRKEMSQLLGCDVNTIIKYESSGTLVAKRKGNLNVFAVWESITAVVTALRASAAGRSKDEAMQSLEEEKLKADVKLKQARASKAQLELDEFEGKLHSAEDVEAVMTDHVFAVRGSLLALPGRLAVDLAVVTSPKEVSVRIEQEINAILDELSGYEYSPGEFKRRLSERNNGSTDTDED